MCETPWSQKSSIGDTNMERRKYLGHCGQRRWLPVCIQVSTYTECRRYGTCFSGQICGANSIKFSISVHILLFSNYFGFINCPSEVSILPLPALQGQREEGHIFLVPKVQRQSLGNAICQQFISGPWNQDTGRQEPAGRMWKYLLMYFYLNVKISSDGFLPKIVSKTLFKSGSLQALFQRQWPRNEIPTLWVLHDYEGCWLWVRLRLRLRKRDLRIRGTTCGNEAQQPHFRWGGGYGSFSPSHLRLWDLSRFKVKYLLRQLMRPRTWIVQLFSFQTDWRVSRHFLPSRMFCLLLFHSPRPHCLRHCQRPEEKSFWEDHRWISRQRLPLLFS